MSPRHSFPVLAPVVNVVAVRRDGTSWRYLLLERALPADYAGCWGLVSGSCEEGESAAQTGARELKEETGLTAESLWCTEYLIHFYESIADEIWLSPVLVAMVPDSSHVTLCKENSRFAWLTSAEVAERSTWKDAAQVVAEIEDDLSRFPPRNWRRLDQPTR